MQLSPIVRDLMKANEKIRVDLCPDHFERLIEGNPCATCPSRAENKDAVVAIATALGSDIDRANQAIVTELRSMRTAQADTCKRLESLEHVIRGNGEPGLATRVRVIEELRESQGKNTGTWMAIVSAVIALVLGIVGLIR